MVTSRHKTSEPTLSPEQFVLKAMVSLKNEKFKGVHSVWSGFNKAFRQYFGDTADPIAVTTNMRKEGKIAIFPSRGGVSLYLRSDLKEATLTQHDSDWEKRDSGSSDKKEPTKTDTHNIVLEKILKGNNSLI